MKALTQNQMDLLAVLRLRDAGFTASACERAWRAGERFLLDDRNNGLAGFKRQFTQANREALEAKDEKSPSICPKCGSDDVCGAGVEFEGEGTRTILQHFDCWDKKCGHHWSARYHFLGIVNR